MIEYTLQDRSYPAQIFNRVIHRNHNSHRTTTGRFIIQTMYANGKRANTYAGRHNMIGVEDAAYHNNNAIGTEVVTHGDNNIVALRIYVDGLGVYRPYVFGSLPYYIRRQIDDMVREAFDFIKTVSDDTYGREAHHLKRKTICEEFRQQYANVDDFGTFLELKYNNQGVENAG